MQRRRERDLLHLAVDGVMETRMAMPETRHKNPADGVEVALAFNVPVVHAVGFVDDQRLIEKFGGLLIIDVGVFEKVDLSWSQFHGCAGSPTSVNMASSGRSNSTRPFFAESISVLTQF